MIFQGEAKDIRTLLAIGKKWGYGNCIAHLKREWALSLKKEFDFHWIVACKATNVSAYPEDFGIDEMEKEAHDEQHS